MAIRPIFTAGRGGLAGAILAQGAPLGWFFLSRAFPDIGQEILLYFYLEAATVAVMAAVGHFLGRRAEEMGRLNTQLGVLASEDALTGLANARRQPLELAREVARSRRAGHP